MDKNIKISLILVILLVGIISFDIINTHTIKTSEAGEKYLIDPSSLTTGLPFKSGINEGEGIVALDMPKFISASESKINDNDFVLGLDYNGEVKAYPLKIMQYHEIVNEVINNEPIIVTYCPLCKSGVAFKSEINGERIRFGVSGKLYNSNLVMYDEKTNSYWNQLTGQAIVGDLSGTVLERIKLSFSSWSEWKNKYPNTLILSKNTGFNRNYDITLYQDYFDNQYDLFGTKYNDTRLKPKQVIYPVEIGNKAIAFPDSLKKTVVHKIENKYVIFTNEGIVKIFLSDSMPENTTIGYLENNYEEYETFTSFWFSWIAFKPDTEIISN